MFTDLLLPDKLLHRPCAIACQYDVNPYGGRNHITLTQYRTQRTELGAQDIHSPVPIAAAPAPSTTITSVLPARCSARLPTVSTRSILGLSLSISYCVPHCGQRRALGAREEVLWEVWIHLSRHASCATRVQVQGCVHVFAGVSGSELEVPGIYEWL